MILISLVFNKMTLPNYKTVSALLKELGMDWFEPRIVAWINDFNRINKQTYSPTNLPDRAYQKLTIFLDTFSRIDRFLKSAGKSWSEPMIAKFFREQSTRDPNGIITNRLKLDKWLLLEQVVVENYCPF